MRSPALKIRRLKTQRAQISDVVGAQAREFIQQLRQRLAFAFSLLAQSVKGIERAALSKFDNSSSPIHPIRPLTVDQVADNIEGAPGFTTLISMGPLFGQMTQQRIQS